MTEISYYAIFKEAIMSHCYCYNTVPSLTVDCANNHVLLAQMGFVAMMILFALPF